jgi:hypothetical protein
MMWMRDCCHVVPPSFPDSTMRRSENLVMIQIKYPARRSQEEPPLFNDMVERFIALVEAHRWGARDPRSIFA